MKTGYVEKLYDDILEILLAYDSDIINNGCFVTLCGTLRRHCPEIIKPVRPNNLAEPYGALYEMCFEGRSFEYRLSECASFINILCKEVNVSPHRILLELLIKEV